MSKNRDRLIRLASQAIKKATSTGSSGSGSSGTDWRAIVRKTAETLTGDGRPGSQPGSQPAGSPGFGAGPGIGNPQPGSAAPAADAAAIARYDYLVRTADPANLERMHQEAFGSLTPAQRDAVEKRMREELPAHERPQTATSQDLARAATRAESMRPGRMRGLLARAGTGAAVIGGAGLAGGLLAGVAGGAVASAAAAPLLDQAANLGVDFDALANTLDVGSIADSFGGFASGAGEAVSGMTEQAGSFADKLGNLGGFPFGDLFKR